MYCAVQVHDDAVLPCRLGPYKGMVIKGGKFMKRQIYLLKIRPQGKAVQTARLAQPAMAT